MSDVVVAGVGCTPISEKWDMSFRDLFVDATWKCLDDASTDKVDALYVGNMASGGFVNQENVGTILADYAGLGNVFKQAATGFGDSGECRASHN